MDTSVVTNDGEVSAVVAENPSPTPEVTSPLMTRVSSLFGVSKPSEEVVDADHEDEMTAPEPPAVKEGFETVNLDMPAGGSTTNSSSSMGGDDDMDAGYRSPGRDDDANGSFGSGGEDRAEREVGDGGDSDIDDDEDDEKDEEEDEKGEIDAGVVEVDDEGEAATAAQPKGRRSTMLGQMWGNVTHAFSGARSPSKENGTAGATAAAANTSTESVESDQDDAPIANPVHTKSISDDDGGDGDDDDVTIANQHIGSANAGAAPVSSSVKKTEQSSGRQKSTSWLGSISSLLGKLRGTTSSQTPDDEEFDPYDDSDLWQDVPVTFNDVKERLDQWAAEEVAITDSPFSTVAALRDVDNPDALLAWGVAISKRTKKFARTPSVATTTATATAVAAEAAAAALAAAAADEKGVESFKTNGGVTLKSGDGDGKGEDDGSTEIPLGNESSPSSSTPDATPVDGADTPDSATATSTSTTITPLPAPIVSFDPRAVHRCTILFLFRLADEKLARACAISPTDPRLFYMRARCRQRRGEVAERARDYYHAVFGYLDAAKYFNQTLNIDPTYYVALLHWPRVLERVAFLQPSNSSITDSIDDYLVLFSNAAMREDCDQDHITLKPIIAFVLSESKYVKRSSALQVMKHLATMEDTEIGQQAKRQLEMFITPILESTHDKEKDMDRILTQFAKTQLRRSGLTNEEVLADIDVFLSLIRSRRSSMRSRAYTPAMTFAPGAIERLFVNENPHPLFPHRYLVLTGTHGKVYLCNRKVDGLAVAVKVMTGYKRKGNSKLIRREVALLKSYDCEFIVRLFDAFMWKDEVWAVMEYCDASNLADFIPIAVMEEPEIAYVCKNLLTALNYLHSKNRIHRDLTSFHVLMNRNGEVLLSDMGLCAEILTASVIDDHRYWKAPEILMLERFPAGTAIDIWSFGCIVMEMAQGKPPYGDCHPLKEFFYTVTKGAPELANAKNFSPEFRDFLGCALQPDPLRRASAEDLLAHPFIQKALTQEQFAKVLEFRLWF
eukprot:TRINITY_DN6550_c0_g1_i1.p1 TRINITY_DN6550_c0_g1~~TRINITY_DN6550_c0_g1_i1.p1  ORF type:complete len:1011 (-),score=252.82 TRINITY_DN6550_c0_g1_i1:1135-4167(-)